MERGRSGRVGHMEFQKRNQGSKKEWRIEKRQVGSKGLGNEHGSRGSRDQSSGMVLHRV